MVVTEINTASSTVGSRGVKNEIFPRKVMSQWLSFNGLSSNGYEFWEIWSFLILYTFDLTVQKYCLPALLTEVN